MRRGPPLQMCSVAGVSRRAMGGKWYPLGIHNPETALRLLVCLTPSQPPENCVRKFTAWIVGASRSLDLFYARGKGRIVLSASVGTSKATLP